MRRKINVKKAVAMGLSIIMLGNSTGTWAEALESSSAAQETADEELNLQSEEVSGEESHEEVTEVSVQTETISAEPETVEYPEATSGYPQEILTTAAAEVLPEEVLPENTAAETESGNLEQPTESSEAQTSVEVTEESTEQETESKAENETEVESESEVETEAESELESESESETETQELESFEEPETEGYLAETLVEGDFKYQVSSNQATIVGYLGSDSAITIPATIGGYSVTTIGYQAFYQNQTITEVTLPEGLTTIANGAFAGTGLTSVEIPDSVTRIGSRAFSDCKSLTNIKLSANLEELEEGIIAGTAVESITIPQKVNRADRALSDNKSLKEIIFEEGMESIPYKIAYGASGVEHVELPETVTAIGSSAFYGLSNLKEIQLPEKLKNINDWAFAGTGLTSVEIPDNVTRMGARAFSNCKNLTNIKLSANLEELEEGIIAGTAVESITIPQKVNRADRALSYNENLKEIIFEEGMESIPYRIAYGASGVEHVELPETVTAIGSSAFSGLSNLKEIQLPDGLQVIGNNAFEYSGLASVVIPDSVTSIYREAFVGCTELKNVQLSSSLKTMESEIFKRTQIESITIPCEVMRASNALSGNEYLKEIIFEEGMKFIPDRIAYGESSLQQVIIPESVIHIGDGAFYGCTSMVIFGVPGSDAEEYAIKNNIPFNNIKDVYLGIYKNANYLVKIVAGLNKKPVEGAKIIIDGREEGISDKNGLVKLKCYGTANQRVKIVKKGYKSVYYTGIPWDSNIENVVQMPNIFDSELKLNFGESETELGASTLKGPEITIKGMTFNLFETKIGFKLPLLNNNSVVYDYESGTIKVILGLKDEYKANVKKDDKADSDVYWQKSYQEVKNLVKACGGSADTTKLWNQFSSLRGKLKKINGEAGFGVSGEVAGFIELRLGDEGFEIIDGGIVANLQASGRVKAPVWGLVYSEFELAGSVDGELNIATKNEKIVYSGSLGVSVTPTVSLGIGAGPEGKGLDLKGGLSGTLKGTLSFPATTMEEAFRATLTGKLFIKLSLMSILSKQFSYSFHTLELYPNFGVVIANLEGKMGFEERVIPINGEAYEDAQTQVVTLSDGRSVKVYITDNGTKSTGNHTTLMYSVYSNGVWSTAQPVCETGRADLSPVLKSDGQKAYVVWTNIGKVISTDSDIEAEVYPNMEIWFSELNGDRFSVPERVPNDGNQKMELYYDLCVSDGIAAVAWVENSENDPFMESGTNSIYGRVRQNGTWQDIVALANTSEKIYSTQVSLNQGNVFVQYSNGSSIFSISKDSNTTVDEGNSNKIFDGLTYYLKDQQLYSKTPNGFARALGVYCTTNYQVYEDTVYWTQQNGYKSELYMQKFGTENVVQLTYDNGYIDDFSICRMENGNINIIYTWSEVNEDEELESPYGASYVKTLENTTVYDLECEGIYYDAEQIIPGKEAQFKVSIRNYSSTTVKNVCMRVKGENEAVIYDEQVLSSIGEGEEKEVSFKYTLPNDLSGLNVSVEVYSNEIKEADYQNNEFICTFAETDLSIREASETAMTIVNQGYTTASSVKVEIRLNDAFGKVIAQMDAGDLAPGVSKTLEYTIPTEYLKFENAFDEKLLYVSVTSNTPESLMGDNYITVHVEPGHADGITLDEETVSIPCGEQRTLTAVVTGKDAIDRSVSWCSSNTDIVTVDENGTITGVAVGEADVSAISVDGGYTAICHITVTEPLALTKLTLSKTTLQLKSGETAILTYTCEPQISEEEMKLAKWESNNEEVATVKDGTVTAVGEGNTEITLTLGGLTVSCQVKVTNPVETKFSITEITAPAYNKLKISWSTYEEANGYAIYLMNDDGSYSILKYITDKTILSYVNTVTCGVTYTYKVSPYRLDGKKKVFLTESEPMSAKALPAAPSLQSVNMAAYNKIRITWSKVNGCAGYVIYRSEAENGKYSVLKTVTQASATNYVNVVKTSTTYYYKIRAFVTVNGKKVYGDYSSILSGNVITGSPQNFTIKQAANGKITFTWDKVEDADGYVIYLYYPDTNKYKAIKNVTDIDVLTYGKKMTKGATYHFAMRAYRLVNGIKVYSDYGEIISTK